MTTYNVRHLERLPLGVTYPAIVEHVQRLMNRAPLTPHDALIIDHTGVGRPVFDMFVSRGLNPIGMTITSGDSVTCDGMINRVPKAMLISRVTALLHEGRLKIAKELPDAAALVEELSAFRATVTESGRWTFGARSGAHDDLVLALAIALWRAHGSGQSHQGLLDYISEQVSTGSESKFFIGCDLGQSQDPTAICVIERRRLAHLVQSNERLPLPQGAVVSDVTHLVPQPPAPLPDPVAATFHRLLSFRI